jgi:hypothetical protein
MLNTFAVVSTFASGRSAIRTFLHLESAIAEANRISIDGKVTRTVFDLETEAELLIVYHNG